MERFHDQVKKLVEPFDEILLLDDCSTDDGPYELRQLGYNVIHGGQNVGPGGARNFLASASTASWIHFHDIDDELDPEYVTRVRHHLGPDHDVLFHDVIFIDEASRRPVIVFKWHDDLISDPILTLLKHPMPTPSSVIRRDIFLLAGGFAQDLRCFEDGDLHLRLVAAGARVTALRETLETALRHDEGASQDMRYCHRCRLKFLERYLTELPAKYHQDVRDQILFTARDLLVSGDRETAKKAIEQYRSLGGAFPITKNQLLRIASGYLPDLWVLSSQVAYSRLVTEVRKITGLAIR